MKILTIAVCAFFVLYALSFLTGLSGKNYLPNNDFSCCKNKKLVLKKFYVNRFFGIKVGTGYTTDTLKTASAEECNIVCEE
jgi:hypothetical protein